MQIKRVTDFPVYTKAKVVCKGFLDLSSLYYLDLMVVNFFKLSILHIINYT